MKYLPKVVRGTTEAVQAGLHGHSWVRPNLLWNKSIIISSQLLWNNIHKNTMNITPLGATGSRNNPGAALLNNVQFFCFISLGNKEGRRFGTEVMLCFFCGLISNLFQFFLISLRAKVKLLLSAPVRRLRFPPRAIWETKQ